MRGKVSFRNRPVSIVLFIVAGLWTLQVIRLNNINELWKEDERIDQPIPPPIIHDHTSESRPNDGISFRFLMSQAGHSPFGKMQDMKCVCGCKNNDQQGILSTVRCSFHQTNAPSFCVLQNAHFYGSDPVNFVSADDTAFFGQEAPRIPLIVAVCTVEPAYQRLFTKYEAWSYHKSFGVAFDHVSEHRIANLPTNEACFNNECRIPNEWTWAGTKSPTEQVNNGWKAIGTWSDWSLPGAVGMHSAPQMQNAAVAFIDSADCWIHATTRGASKSGLAMNPWHCKAGLLNWNVLSGLFERFPQSLLGLDSFERKDARFFAFQGYDEFFRGGKPNGDGSVVGWPDILSAAGSGLEPNFHDDDHKITGALNSDRRGTKDYRVKWQGCLPTAVLNMPPGHSFLWDNTLIPPNNRPSEIIVDFRKHLTQTIMTTLRFSSDRHPLDQLLRDYPDHVQLMLPSDPIQSRSLNSFMEKEIQSYGFADWKLRILPRIALVWRRSPLSSDRIGPDCKRCLTNIVEIAKAIADNLDEGMAVLLIQPTSHIPAALQTYAIFSTKLLVAMHGGAFGNAIGLSNAQAAIEILPARESASEHINAQYFCGLGGASCRVSLCPNCVASKSKTGSANVTDVIWQAKQALHQTADHSA